MVRQIRAGLRQRADELDRRLGPMWGWNRTDGLRFLLEPRGPRLSVLMEQLCNVRDLGLGQRRTIDQPEIAVQFPAGT
ncbi:hypothetical protein [Rhodococcus jostii]|uniref:hypothetical protein n=1 Tax=Rhodococcus jostii TaxID=132919 RepID=UPI0013C312E5|nr:hypothetical protein [Rhodococcus jostii]